jgi:branched-chain amino acid transport system permease protein
VRWGIRLASAVALCAALAGAQWLLSQYVIDYVVRVILICGINAILAVGLNLINGTTGQFSIGHAGFMAVGAYTTAFTVIQLEAMLGYSQANQPDLVSRGLILSTGLVVGGVAAGLTGLAVGAPSLRLRGDYLAIVTLGFGEIIRLLFNNAESLGGATGYSGGRPLGLPTYSTFFWVFAWATLLILLVRNLTFSSYGRALRAIREDEIAAEAVGVRTTRMKVLAFAVSAATVGVAGGLFAHMQSTIRPDDFKMDRSVAMMVMIIVGGLGSVSGAILGAIFVAVTLELMRDIQQYRMLAYALMLIVLMIARPGGLLGSRELTFGLGRRREKPA